MGYRPSKRVLWLVLPLVTVAVVLGLLWHSGVKDAEALVNRGAREAVERKFSPLDPGSWTEAGGTGRWFGEGVESVMTWKHNPWRRERVHLGQRLLQLRDSTDPADQAEYQRLRKLGREWQERLLERYPELALPEDKVVPEEKNAFLKLMALFKDIDDAKVGFSPLLPDELKGPGPLSDTRAAQDIVAKNREVIDQLREIGLMTEHSSNGYDPVRQRSNPYNLLWGGDLLLLEARLAAAQGDTARALESIRAARGLTDHLTGVSAAGTLEGGLAGVLQGQIRMHLMESILPSLPADGIDLAEWEAAGGAGVTRPPDPAGMQRADWNTMMSELLPALVNTSDVSVPADADLLVEIYTRNMRERASMQGSGAPGDMANQPRPDPAVDHLSWRSRDLADAIGLKENIGDQRDSWLAQQASTGMTQAAFAILHGKPVPNDPVSGLPYRWDPATRQLSMPDTPRYRSFDIRPVKVPKIR
ncbi:MAG: hypothetical protein EOP88_05915 [Verrucomicrobiaceae bacterium]|nr:MAG: hypothetical protein EOP88_05915 [Verrucomicrobiaceae bacterium]